MACASKLPALFTVFPFLCIWSYSIYEKEKKHLFFKSLLIVLIFAFTAAIPFFIRNWYMTKNPFFPAFNSLFESQWLSETLGKEYALTQFSNQKDIFLTLLIKRLILIKDRDLLLYILPLACLFGRARTLALVSISGILIFLLTMKTASGENDGTLLLRYLGPALILGIAISSAWLLDELQKLIQKPSLQSVPSIILAGFFIFHSVYNPPVFYPFKPFLNIAVAPTIPYAVRELSIGGKSKAWLRLNAKPSDFILSAGDNQIYYLSHLNVSTVLEQPTFDHLLSTSTDLKDFLIKISPFTPRYLFDSKHFELFYWSKLSFWLYQAAIDYPECIAYLAQDSIVIDYPILANALGASHISKTQYFF
ncbi:MAG: hypothetical protein KA715_13335 [Xanthomonadaceae bacterium]|nr:hypothetical protein [Xanthomonadaceae bacterium]